MSAYPIAIYGNGLFQDGYPTPPVPYTTQAQQLNEGITTVILWSIHIHEGGDLYLNDTLFVSKGQIQYATDGSSGVNPDYPALVKQLMSGGSVRDLLVSVGAWGTTSDFTAWLASRDQVKTNLAVLQSTFGITGVDFDYEGDYTADDQKMIVTLTLDVGSLGLYATYCPYMSEAFWTGCLVNVYAQNGHKQIVKWMNLQCYAGGSSNHPKAWAQALANTSDTGVTDPYAFIVPGYAVEGAEGEGPSSIQQAFSQLAGSGITGGFLWNSSGIFTTEASGGPTPADYAAAINAGLGASAAAREAVDA